MMSNALSGRSALRKWLLWCLLLSFGSYTIWVMIDVGYLGIWLAGFASPGSLQIFLDLVICCLLFCVWLLGDAKSRGISPVPWILATCATGTITPLIYLLIREYQQPLK